MKTIGFLPVVLTIYTKTLAKIDLFSYHKYTGDMVKPSRFPTGEWARERKKKRAILVQANRSIEELEGNISELKRKVKLSFVFVSAY